VCGYASVPASETLPARRSPRAPGDRIRPLRGLGLRPRRHSRLPARLGRARYTAYTNQIAVFRTFRFSRSLVWRVVRVFRVRACVADPRDSRGVRETEKGKERGICPSANQRRDPGSGVIKIVWGTGCEWGGSVTGFPSRVAWTPLRGAQAPDRVGSGRYEFWRGGLGPAGRGIAPPVPVPLDAVLRPAVAFAVLSNENPHYCPCLDV